MMALPPEKVNEYLTSHPLKNMIKAMIISKALILDEISKRG
jgi:hypothetical protein